MNILIIVYITIFLIKGCTFQCTHFYIMLKEYEEDFGDEIKQAIEPITMSTIQSKYSYFNTTKVFKTLSENSGCILEFDTTCASSTYCPKPVKPTNLLGTDVYDMSGLKNKSSIIVPKTTKSPPISKIMDTKIIPTTDATSTIDDIVTTTDVTTTVDVTTIDNVVTTTDVTTIDDIVTTTDVTTDPTTMNDTITENALAGNASALRYSENKDMRIEKAALLAVTATSGTAALMYLIAKKIIHMQQYGAYHLP